jgi:hypothetical protein
LGAQGQGQGQREGQMKQAKPKIISDGRWEHTHVTVGDYEIFVTKLELYYDSEGILKAKFETPVDLESTGILGPRGWDTR